MNISSFQSPEIGKHMFKIGLTLILFMPVLSFKIWALYFQKKGWGVYFFWERYGRRRLWSKEKICSNGILQSKVTKKIKMIVAKALSLFCYHVIYGRVTLVMVITRSLSQSNPLICYGENRRQEYIPKYILSQDNVFIMISLLILYASVCLHIILA